MGGSAFWSGIASGAMSEVILWVGDLAPLLVMFVGVSAFGLVVYIVRRIAS